MGNNPPNNLGLKKLPEGKPSLETGWVTRNRDNLFLALAVLLLLFLQWPAVKNVGCRVLGMKVGDDGIPWRTDYQSAMAEAQQSGKPMLLDFGASWCSACVTMKQDVWPDPEIRQAVISGYIPVAIDVDVAANRPLITQYGIDPIPTVIIVGPHGEVLKQGEFMSRRTLLKFLQKSPVEPVSSLR